MTPRVTCTFGCKRNPFERQKLSLTAGFLCNVQLFLLNGIFEPDKNREELTYSRCERKLLSRSGGGGGSLLEKLDKILFFSFFFLSLLTRSAVERGWRERASN